MSYLILFDIGRANNAMRLKVNRYLKKIGSTMFQHSVWEFDNLADLKQIAKWIKNSGGKAVILKKVVVK